MLGIELQSLVSGPMMVTVYGVVVLLILYRINKSFTKVKSVTCPNCGSTMVIRRASKGKHTGKPFWGCVIYAKNGCTGIRSK